MKTKELTQVQHLKVAGFVTLITLILCLIFILKGFGNEALWLFIGFLFGLIAMNESRNGQAQ